MPRAVRLMLCAMVAGVASVAASAGCRGKPPEQATSIIIVSCFPKTESDKQSIENLNRGMRMAFEEHNWRVGEYSLEFAEMNSAADGAWTREAEAKQAELVAKNASVMMFLGPLDDAAAQVSAAILKRADVAMISPTDSTPASQSEWNSPKDGTSPNYFKIAPPNDVQGARAADWMKSLGFAKVCILTDASDYGRGLARWFSERAKANAMQVLSQETIQLDETVFKQQVEKIANLTPHVVFFAGNERTISAAIVRASALSCPMLVSDRCYDPRFVQTVGANLLNERCYVTMGGLPPGEWPDEAVRFPRRYQRKYETPPDVLALYGYEAARLAIHTLERSRTKNRIATLDSLLLMPEFESILGRRKMSDKGVLSSPSISGYLVRNGQFELVGELK